MITWPVPRTKDTGPVPCSDETVVWVMRPATGELDAGHLTGTRPNTPTARHHPDRPVAHLG